MKNILNTLFFGYLSYKWKRLALTITIVAFLIITYISYDISSYNVFEENVIFCMFFENSPKEQ